MEIKGQILARSSRGFRRSANLALVAMAFGSIWSTALAQRAGIGAESRSAGSNAAPAPVPEAKLPEPSERERWLLVRIDKLEKRLAEVEARLAPAVATNDLPAAVTTADPAGSTSVAEPKPAKQNGLSEEDRKTLDYFRGTTVNFVLDGYYGFNFNRPVGRVNLLRAYDVLSNAFSLNQAAIVIEHAPKVAEGQRFGARLDLQFGQATETLQGNPANEPRPQVYRHVFQAYGTYVAPVGKGLTLDVGKWASSLGLEGNYTKDQMNYSRSYWFNYLPFYHMGVRANYKVNDKLALNYWLVNGAQQTEPFKDFKDQMFGVVVQPVKTVTWTANYYFGQEHPDVRQVPNPGPAPVQPGLGFEPIVPAPDGRLHIFDNYLTWQASPKITVAAEGDYVIQRLFRHDGPGQPSAPGTVWGGAFWARYQFAPKWAVAGRAEYLSDRNGLFSGVSQALKETTVTFDYKPEDGFLLRSEWRRDFSNQPFFLPREFGARKKEQNTVTIGLVWWWGRKEGTW
jgi:hypothetical protein